MYSKFNFSFNLQAISPDLRFQAIYMTNSKKQQFETFQQNPACTLIWQVDHPTDT
jgi:hypothetical protein